MALRVLHPSFSFHLHLGLAGPLNRWGWRRRRRLITFPLHFFFPLALVNQARLQQQHQQCRRRDSMMTLKFVGHRFHGSFFSYSFRYTLQPWKSWQPSYTIINIHFVSPRENGICKQLSQFAAWVPSSLTDYTVYSIFQGISSVFILCEHWKWSKKGTHTKGTYTKGTYTKGIYANYKCM